jgi:hypothetical protein
VNKFASLIVATAAELFAHTKVARFALVGTAAYPDEAGVDPKDVDFLVLCHGDHVGMGVLEPDELEALPRHAFGAGWDNGGSNALDADGDQWGSIRKGDINLILTTDAEWYDRSVKASAVCVALRLTEKFDRIVAYRVVRDGFEPEAARAEAEEIMNAYAEGERQRAIDAECDRIAAEILK